MDSAYLNPDDRRTVAEAAAVLGDLSADERPLLTIAKSIKALSANAESVIAEWSAGGSGGSMIFTANPRMRAFADHPPAHRWQPVFARYRRDGRDSSQHRVVDFLTALGGDRERMQLYQRLVYQSLDVRDQLRVLVGEAGQGPLTCCMVFSSAPRTPRVREMALLQALVPALRDAVVSYRALGASLGTLAETARALEAFDEPAWLCSEYGRVLHRNEAASHVGRETPACVLAAARAPAAASACTHARRLFLADSAAVLVLFRRRAANRSSSADLTASARLAALLPATLAAIADLIVGGHTDAQIARLLGRPLATVRTYVARIYRRLGVHGRAELVHLARESFDLNAFEPAPSTTSTKGTIQC